MAAIQNRSGIAGAALFALLLAACSKDAASPTSEPAVPAPAPAQAPSPPPAESVPAPDATEPAPSPAPEPPPPTEPSAVPKPTSVEPDLESMRAASPGAKMGVPVDLRYQFESDPVPGRPVILHLAAIPRVAGTGLHVSVKAAEGLQLASAPLQIQKVAATSAYRQQLSVTRLASGPENLRVLVTMDLAEGKAFGYFSVPLDGSVPPASGKTAQKQHSVKQR
jgi:outer membrane biosynthesis protein TonB